VNLEAASMLKSMHKHQRIANYYYGVGKKAMVNNNETALLFLPRTL
jgi:hypothetical protein